MTRIDAPASSASRGVIDPLLVAAACRRPGECPGTTKKPSGQACARGRDLVAGADDAVEPGCRGQAPASRSTWSCGVPLTPDRGEIVAVEAGQHGDGDDLGSGRRCRLGIFQHRPAAGGMDGEDRRLERRSAWTALATVLGMSWSLRSRKIGKPSSAISRTPAGPFAAKNSRPSLIPPAWRLTACGDRRGPLEVGRVDGDEDRAAHSADPRRGGRAAGVGSGRPAVRPPRAGAAAARSCRA